MFHFSPEQRLEKACSDYLKQLTVDSVSDIPDELGIFYARSANLGGLIRKSYTMQVTEDDTQSGLTAELNGTYHGLIGGGASFGESTDTRSNGAAMSVSFHAQGGDTSFWLKPDEDLDAIQKQWADSFDNGGSLYPWDVELRPIWELVAKVDKAKGDALQKYLTDKWAKESDAFNPTRFFQPGDVPPMPQPPSPPPPYGLAMCQDGLCIEYKGFHYRTLESTDPEGRGRGPCTCTENSTCPANWLAVPGGWSLAPNDAHAVYVIKHHFWNAGCVVLADSSGWLSAQYDDGHAGYSCFYNTDHGWPKNDGTEWLATCEAGKVTSGTRGEYVAHHGPSVGDSCPAASSPMYTVPSCYQDYSVVLLRLYGA